MTSDEEEKILREHQKTFHKLVAKSWLDPTLRGRLKRDPAEAMKELGVTALTKAETEAVAKFIDDGIDRPEPLIRAALDPRSIERILFEDRATVMPGSAESVGSTSNAELGFSMEKPRLVAHVYVRAEQPNASGTEALHFVSSRRQIKLAGRRLCSFRDVVLPLLDGYHTVNAIEAASRHHFRPSELRRSLELLDSHNLLQDADKDTLSEATRTQLAPQLNFFHELGRDAQETQAKLMGATVTIFGMGGTGAAVCLSLAGAHVGNLRCIDALPVSSSDPMIAPTFPAGSVGHPRAKVVADMIKAVAPDVTVTACTDVLETDDDVLRVVEGSDFVVCCIDAGLTSLAYKVNRACLRAKISWMACSASAFEGVVGPTVEPFSTACYLCYQMREAACADRPEDALAHLEFLDARKTDDSGVRESNAFSAGAIGNLAALEAFKRLSGVVEPVSLGHIVVLDFLRLTTTRHSVLRKPDCPVCSQTEKAGGGPPKQ